jgi:hypothetical protein
MKGVIYEKRVQLPGQDHQKGPIVLYRLTLEKNGYLLLLVHLDTTTHNECTSDKKEVVGWWDRLLSGARECAVETAVDEARKAESGEVEE